MLSWQYKHLRFCIYDCNLVTRSTIFSWTTISTAGELLHNFICCDDNSKLCFVNTSVAVMCLQWWSWMKDVGIHAFDHHDVIIAVPCLQQQLMHTDCRFTKQGAWLLCPSGLGSDCFYKSTCCTTVRPSLWCHPSRSLSAITTNEYWLPIHKTGCQTALSFIILLCKFYAHGVGLCSYNEITWSSVGFIVAWNYTLPLSLLACSDHMGCQPSNQSPQWILWMGLFMFMKAYKVRRLCHSVMPTVSS